MLQRPFRFARYFCNFVKPGTKARPRVASEQQALSFENSLWIIESF